MTSLLPKAEVYLRTADAAYVRIGQTASVDMATGFDWSPPPFVAMMARKALAEYRKGQPKHTIRSIGQRIMARAAT